MFKHTSKLTLLIASGLLLSVSAHASKGAQYQPPPKHSGKGAQYQPPPKKESFPHNFYLAAGFNYLLATHEGLPFATLTTQASPTSLSTHKYYLNPNYKFGYYVGAGYLISEVYDLQASWMQLNTNNTNSTSGQGPILSYQTMTSYGIATGGLGAGETFTGKTSETLNYQVLDVNLGQYHDVGSKLSARLFAGIRYASIVDNVKNTYTASNTFNGQAFIEKLDSTYNGVGPEFGLDARYQIYGTLSMVGTLTGAFLVGDVTATSYVPVVSDTYDSVSTNAAARVVPGLDTKLGLHAGIPFAGYKDRIFVEAGYELAYYFGAINQMIVIEYLLYNGDNFSDASISGPYMNFGARF